MGHLGVIATSVGVQKIFCSVVRSNKYVFGRCLEEMLFSSWNTMVIEMSLLDFLAYKTGCQVGELPTVAKEDPIWISAFGDVDEAGYRIAEWMERRTGLPVPFAASRIL